MCRSDVKRPRKSRGRLMFGREWPEDEKPCAILEKCSGCTAPVNPSLNRVTSGHRTFRSNPKSSGARRLAERPGDVVTRDDLMTRVWPDVFVTDDVMHRAIRELRRLFDDAAEQPAVIETIRKRGYRLAAPHRARRPAAAGGRRRPKWAAPAASCRGRSAAGGNDVAPPDRRAPASSRLRRRHSACPVRRASTPKRACE